MATPVVDSNVRLGLTPEYDRLPFEKNFFLSLFLVLAQKFFFSEYKINYS